MTLNLAIIINAEENCSKHSVEELMVSHPATAIKELSPSSISFNLMKNRTTLSLPSLEQLHDDTPACSVTSSKTSKKKSAKLAKEKLHRDTLVKAFAQINYDKL